ncbi:AAA family ATPase [Telmatocola sphagniphila]|uniref:AAA family ATPase n=1 Tax=Telmatocola sphagniphila TaxID=1123043 RepID=A0A8E6B9G5_9BACT|nr:AAA family ATPase [Telmatocola sphagniphila]QVL34186.1 AAA family ATPase [Telmatocola sphagniphila]
MHRIAIVDPTEASRESLRTMLLGVDFVWLEAECARYEYFFDVIQNSLPELVIVALDGDRQKALNMISQVASMYPKLPILTISDDSGTLLQSLQRGARYFISPPINLEDLLSTLRRALSEVSSAPVGQQDSSAAPSTVRTNSSKIVTVLGSRGGVGCTTIAVNLAATLAADPANNVALIDLDLALGDADIAIELPGNENISLADLARNIERLDMNYLRRALVKHESSGLSVLRHPLELTDVSIIHEGHIERILNLLKISYNYLIIDLTKSLLPTDLMALRMSDKILLVTQLELSALRNVVRLNHALNQEPELGEKVEIVVNRSGSDHLEDGITLKKAEEVIGKKIYWQVPNDSKTVMQSRTHGEPLIKMAPKCRAQQSIQGLAQAIMGRSINVADNAKKKGWFS